MRLLLTDTLVPRDTKSLVAGVSAKRLSEPEVVDPILDAIQSISDQAQSLLGGREMVDQALMISQLEVSSHCTPIQAGNGFSQALTIIKVFDSGESCVPCQTWGLSSITRDDRFGNRIRTVRTRHQVDWGRWRRMCCNVDPRWSVQLSQWAYIGSLLLEPLAHFNRELTKL